MLPGSNSGSKDQPRSAAAKHRGKKLKLNKRAFCWRKFLNASVCEEIKMLLEVLIHVGWNGMTPTYEGTPTHSPLAITSITKHLSYGQNLVHGEGTSLSRVGPYRFCSGGTLDKPSEGIVFGIVLGWVPIGFAVMATPRPSQYYFGHT